MPGVKDSVNGADFNRRIQIQANTPTENADGGQTDSWATIYTCWANFVDKIRAMGYKRALMFFQLYPTADRVMQIRYQTSTRIDATMRVLYVSHGINHTYQILGVYVPSEANVSMWISCRENQAKAGN